MIVAEIVSPAEKIVAKKISVFFSRRSGVPILNAKTYRGRIILDCEDAAPCI